YNQSTKIFFHTPTFGYNWHFERDLSPEEMDSLTHLTIEEQDAYINKKYPVIDSNRLKPFDVMPIEFKSNTWYAISGLDNQGTYYLFFDKKKNLKVVYASGP